MMDNSMMQPGRLVMLMVALADGRMFHPNTYLRSFDPNANNGNGSYDFTHHIEAAMKFNNIEEGWTLWKTQSTARPFRIDGKPNRPLTMFTVEFVSAENQTFWNSLANNPTVN